MPEWIDISLPIHSQMTVAPGLPVTEVISQPLMSTSESVTRLHLNLTAGTYLISPNNLQSDTQRLLSQINGPCRVITIKTSAPHITHEQLIAHHILPGSRILFKTKNSRLLAENRYQTEFITFTTQAAQYLADRRVNLIGFDYYHIDPYGSMPGTVSHPFHTASIPLLLGINLDPISPGNYELLCLPLAAPNLDTRPCRAVLQHD